jgi:hypothetical protein
MTKREFKKKHNALSKEHQKIIKQHTKAIQYLTNLTKTRDMLRKQIQDLETKYYTNAQEN